MCLSVYMADFTAIGLRVNPASKNSIDLTQSEENPSSNVVFGWRFYAVFTSLCIITLAVALGHATKLSVALPVSIT